MNTCSHCGAPIDKIPKGQTLRCKFCGVENTAPPDEVQVPVPVQVVRTVAVESGAERRCPHCSKLLVAVIVSEVQLDGCGSCGGIWIDNTSARRVLDQPQKIFADLAERCAVNAQRKDRVERPKCPACPAILDRSHVHNIELDICGDHGTWFDAFELQMLTAVLLGDEQMKRRVAAKLQAKLVPCAECNKSIRAELANIGEHGPTCDTCWRKRQKQLVREFDEQNSDNSKVAVGVAAVMLGGLALLTSSD